MNAPSLDVIDMLLAWVSSASSSEELGLTFADNLFQGKIPATPDDCVTVIDTPGAPPWLGLAGETGYDYVSVQITVRNTDYNLGLNLASRIKGSLHGRANETWNGSRYTAIICMNDPFLLEWDDNGCARFIVNVNLQRVAA